MPDLDSINHSGWTAAKWQ